MLDRRAFVRGVGSLSLAGALAGCSGGGGGGEGGEETETETETETEAATATATATAASGGEVPAAVSDYLSDTGNFDGSIADLTGQGEVTVDVGASGNGGNFAFAPPAIRVDAGTTVVWEWTGKGGQHNVVAESGAEFQSKLFSEAGHTFSATLDAAGVVTYYCEPHRSLGMKGAIVVE